MAGRLRHCGLRVSGRGAVSHHALEGQVIWQDAFIQVPAAPRYVVLKLGIYRPGVKEGTVKEGETTQVIFGGWEIW